MSGQPLMPRYPVGAEIQYRDGHVKVKTAEHGLVPKSRVVASISSKVVNGGEELKPGWRVVHLDMSSYGEPDHDRPENLAVIRCRTTKFVFLKTSRILFLPKTKGASKSLTSLTIK